MTRIFNFLCETFVIALGFLLMFGAVFGNIDITFHGEHITPSLSASLTFLSGMAILYIGSSHTFKS